MKKVLPLCLLCLLLYTLSFAQEKEYKVVLNNGNVFHASIIEQGEGSFTFFVSGGEISFQQSEIKDIIPTGRTYLRKKERRIVKKNRSQKKAVPKNITSFDDLISFFARKYSLDPALVKAVIKAESNFDQYCVSHKGATGLMQLMPNTARGLGVFDIYSPNQNIEGGTRFLASLLRDFGDVKLALAAYNAGPEAVRKYGGIPPYKETKNYVNNVLYYWNYFSTKRIHIQKPIYMHTDANGNVYLSDVKMSDEYKKIQ